MQSRFQLPDNLLDNLPDDRRTPGLWVVGGAIRDHLLGRSYEDLDFAVDGDAIVLARQLADALNWHFYALDVERGTARILSKDASGAIRRMDFSRLRGDSIEQDLEHRDFTINALGIHVHEPENLIDPTGGVTDIRMKRLRACRDDSLREDPVRVIRTVRFATELGLTIHSETANQVRGAVDRLNQVSVERTRDELFQLLTGTSVDVAVRLLGHFQILNAIFWMIAPRDALVEELEANVGLADAAGSHVSGFVKLTSILRPEHDAEAAADAIWGSVSLRLGRFRKHLSQHLEECISVDRTRKSLIVFASMALAYAMNLSESVADRPIKDFVGDCGKAIRLSRGELEYLVKLTTAFRTLEEAEDDELLTDLDFHRYFYEFGEGGVGGVLLYLSYAVANAPGPPDADLWEHRLGVARSLLRAYFDRYDQVVDPETFVDGSSLMDALGITPGPVVGELLDAIREASVTKRVSSREQALEYARLLAKGDEGS